MDAATGGAEMSDVDFVKHWREVAEIADDPSNVWVVKIPAKAVLRLVALAEAGMRDTLSGGSK